MVVMVGMVVVVMVVVIMVVIIVGGLHNTVLASRSYKR
jgi:hypothetical protein